MPGKDKKTQLTRIVLSYAATALIVRGRIRSRHADEDSEGLAMFADEPEARVEGREEREGRRHARRGGDPVAHPLIDEGGAEPGLHVLRGVGPDGIGSGHVQHDTADDEPDRRPSPRDGRDRRGGHVR